MKQKILLVSIGLILCFTIPALSDETVPFKDHWEKIQALFEQYHKTVPNSFKDMIVRPDEIDLQEHTIALVVHDIAELLQDPELPEAPLGETLQELEHALTDYLAHLDSVSTDSLERKKNRETVCNLFVTKLLTVCSIVSLYGPMTINPLTRAAAALLTVNGNAAIDGTLIVENLLVEDATAFANLVFNNIIVLNDLTVHDTATLNILNAGDTTFGTMAVNGNVTMSDSIAINPAAGNAITINTNTFIVDADGNTKVNNLTVNGTFNVPNFGNITINGTLTVTGAVTLQNTLNVTGNTTFSTVATSGLAALNSMSVTNNATVGGTLGVTGNTTLSTVSTSGLATLTSLVVTNSATIGTILGVTGDLTLAANVNMNNTSSSAVGVVTKGGSPFIHNFGTNNTFLGVNSGNFTTTGSNNSAMGVEAGLTLGNSSNSVLAGYRAGRLADASQTVIVGSEAASLAPSLTDNLIIGSSAAGNAATIGNGNVIVGYQAGLNLTGGLNVIIGQGAGPSVTQQENLMIGSSATPPGAVLTSGNYNIFIGPTAGSAITNGDTNIIFGTTGPAGAATGQVYLGNQTHTNLYLLTNGSNSATSLPTAAATQPLQIDNTTGAVTRFTSSARYKTNIMPMVDMSTIIKQLQPVTFNPNSDLARTCYGLLAEDVARIDSNVVCFDTEGRPDSVHYEAFIPMLIKAYQLQKQELLYEQQVYANMITELIELENITKTISW